VLRQLASRSTFPPDRGSTAVRNPRRSRSARQATGEAQRQSLVASPRVGAPQIRTQTPPPQSRSASLDGEDLAAGLARTPRWGGSSKWEHSLSVARHSLTVLALRELDGPLNVRAILPGSADPAARCVDIEVCDGCRDVELALIGRLAQANGRDVFRRLKFDPLISDLFGCLLWREAGGGGC
jgi:hypothetical protein